MRDQPKAAGRGTQHDAAGTEIFDWKLVYGFWTLVALISLVGTYIHSLYMPNMSLRGGIFLLPYLLWALLTRPTFWLVKRLLFERRKPLAGVLIIIFVGLIVAFTHSAFEEFLLYLGNFHMSDYAKSISGLLIHYIIPHLHTKVLIYCAIVGAGYAFHYYQQSHARVLEIGRLEAQLVQAKMTALKMQIHPHFLFNTLNTISAYVERDPVAARRMVVRLSELLRMTLEEGQSQEISLRQELSFIRNYLEIEQVRFQDRLRVRIEVPEDVLNARVPKMLLQPIVENAIRHGISDSIDSGHVGIRAVRNNGQLTIQIDDDGPGLGGSHGLGIGLKNTQLRLNQLYGDAAALQLSNGKKGGALVQINLPFRDASKATAYDPD